MLLREMREAILEIQSTIGTLAPSELASDTLRRSALLWHFTVLGEAANQVSAATQNRFVAIAWRDATRMRNRLVHGYWDIDFSTLIATSNDDLPTMLDALQEAIATLDAE